MNSVVVAELGSLGQNKKPPNLAAQGAFDSLTFLSLTEAFAQLQPTSAINCDRDEQ